MRNQLAAIRVNSQLAQRALKVATSESIARAQGAVSRIDATVEVLLREMQDEADDGTEAGLASPSGQ